MFGGVGRFPVSHVENFNEDSLEFVKVSDRKQVNAANTLRFTSQSAMQSKTSLKKPKAATSGRGSIRNVGVHLNFRETPIMEPASRKATEQDEKVETQEEFRKDNGRFYHLMLPYKHYLLVYGG